jgi:8-oxo-dGTP pyrophosphatase MutT (NUDIX family)
MTNPITGWAEWKLLDYLFREARALRYLRFKVVSPAKDIRVSVCALIRLAHRDSYLLVRSLHRPESFGPFGGVYKHHSSAAKRLDSIEFRPQRASHLDEMDRDLRGFIPRRALFAFIHWFNGGTHREDASACLRRELHEELEEAGLDGDLTVPHNIGFRLVRRVYEYTKSVPGHNYAQYRMLEIYDVADFDPNITRFIDTLWVAARSNSNLLIATSNELLIGRASDGRVIGHHCGYLFRNTRIRPDEPIFAEAVGSPR